MYRRSYLLWSCVIVNPYIYIYIYTSGRSSRLSRRRLVDNAKNFQQLFLSLSCRSPQRREPLFAATFVSVPRLRSYNPASTPLAAHRYRKENAIIPWYIYRLSSAGRGPPVLKNCFCVFFRGAEKRVRARLFLQNTQRNLLFMVLLYTIFCHPTMCSMAWASFGSARPTAVDPLSLVAPSISCRSLGSNNRRSSVVARYS